MKKSGFSSIISSLIFGFLGAFLASAVIFAALAANQKSVINYILNKASQQTQELIDKGAIGDENNKVITQESLLVSAIDRANPAVVSIVITKDVPVLEKSYSNPFGSDPFFDQFFGGIQIPQYKQNGTQKQEVGGGSGFFVSKDGMIVTNKHVVSDDQAEYTVLTNDGKKHDAKIVAKDPVNDIAIIKIDGNDYPYLTFADSDSVKVGQTAIAIGNALGEFRNTVSVGIISGLSRSITAGDSQGGSSELLEGVIQTDAAINPGNSGGPLLNLNGKVMGVNVAIVQGSQNIGFALPSNLVKSVVDSVKKDGKIVRPYLGVRYVMINDSIKDKNKLTVDYGALIARGDTKEELAVLPGSPADKAGLVENDIILEVDGVKIEGDNTLSKLMQGKNVGDVVTLKVLHKGEETTYKVTLGEMPQ